MPASSDLTAWSTIATVALGSSVVGTMVGKVLDRSNSRTDAVRSGYADAAKALNAWGQFPLRIRRRVDDEPATLARLEALGAEIQESLAYATAWVAADSVELGHVFNHLVQSLRAEVTVHARQAWAAGPVTTGGAMNIAGQPRANEEPSGVPPAEWVAVQLFASVIHYRVGWRRYMWSRPLLRRRLGRLSIPELVEEAFKSRSARLLHQAVPDSSDPDLAS
ncbi:hypothetical protein [Kribbella sp. NPDC051620]|uniref:hypothetical protein n=1 Tax=Kribbella sp. NPDC051620 TaxID=3364120 RepID=UPI0037B9147A